MFEAMYYSKIKHNYIICKLCPHLCKIEPGGIGICRVRKNIDGRLYSLNYGRITSYAYDRIEKKPLYNFHPGSNIFSIGSYGCNLRCEFCQNWRIAHENPPTREIPDRDVIKLAKSNKSIGIAYTYNEPTIWYEYVYDLSRKAKDEGLANVWVTNGYINPKPLEEILPYIDAMNIDLKSISDEFYQDICLGSFNPVLTTIKKAAENLHIEITCLLIDGLNTNIEKIAKLAKTIGQINKDIPLHLSRYFPAYKMDRPATKIQTIIEAVDEARKHLNYVYMGNVF